jgi:hypothetical protein
MPVFSPTIQTPPVFNLGGTYENSLQPSFQSPPIDQKLASLFANRDNGQDTFENTGALR